ncbi:oxidoreductase [Mesorhizobium sp. Root157]|uniref:SDR family NAD(P)-dependent oxidoreductase n=1 Tax=Mesorhizobium sp. Root157 TaxID=1736477 RepID=UPI0006FF3EA7|nr:SDR family NAD(P)-dependent oxidoreductase [Mesorhizobium sp. Root157]KQZ96529.1 oxidoreductase [Mesorhizobium sp. Root157]
MRLYRANPKDGVAWITGGSSGIGRALAKQLATAGYTVAVTAREGDPIDMLIAEAALLPGKIVSFPCDVADEARMAATVAAIEGRIGPIALAVFNAGAYVPIAGENLSVRKFRRTFEVNVLGVVHGLVPVARCMQARGRGQILLVGSISAWFGWPTTAAYGASKAAVNVMAQALKYDFDKINIRIQVANPGFVDTPLLKQSAPSLPAMIPAGEAARRLFKGIASGGFEIAFPRRLVWGLKLASIMPQPVRHWLISTLTRWKSRPLSFGRNRPR